MTESNVNVEPLWDIQYQINGGEWHQFTMKDPISIGVKPSIEKIYYSTLAKMMRNGGVTFIAIDCEDRGQHYMNLKFRKVYP